VNLISKNANLCDYDTSTNGYADIDPKAEFFKNYGWLEKNSADIRLSRIIVISKKYG